MNQLENGIAFIKLKIVRKISCVLDLMPADVNNPVEVDRVVFHTSDSLQLIPLKDHEECRIYRILQFL